VPSSDDWFGHIHPLGNRWVSDGFRFSPDILARLGEELVPDADQGIVELAKNAYDADATNCTVRLEAVHSGHGSISISDNGTGMTAEMVRGGWLVIGRSSKQQKAATDIYSRVPAGDKGLGRLAALRLGDKVELRTRPIAEPGVEHRLVIDWSAFAAAEHVEDVAIEVETFDTDQPHGTDILIERVSDKFGRSAVNKLARSLLLLSDPFRGSAELPSQTAVPVPASDGEGAVRSDPGFSARLETQEFADLEAKVSNAYFSDAQYRIHAEVDAQGKVTFRLLDWKDDTLHETIAGATYEAPTMTFDLWVYILDAQSFSTRNSTVGEVREWLTEVGGVHIYEDGIRVPPYGGSGDDWLEMNLRRVRSPEGRPSTNTSIGVVRLSNVSGILAQKTDRNGYIESEAFQELRRVCTDALEWSAKIQIRERDERRQAEKEAIARSTTTAQTKLNNVLDKSVKSTERKKVEKAIEQLVRDSGVENRSLREELQLYRSLATAGMTSAVLMHEIGRPLSMIDKAIDSLRRLIPADKHADAEQRIARIGRVKQRLSSFISIPLTLLAKRKRRSGRVDVNECIVDLKALLEPVTGFFKVEVDLDPVAGHAIINGSVALIDGICLNLVMNALNAFQREGYSQPQRIIRLHTMQDDAHVALIVEDNAGGIDGVELNEIWLPGVTTSQEGTGFGLTIVRDSVADLGGTIEVLAKTEFGGARFTARFPVMGLL
jgi:signal transduction histidine kinase